MSSDKTLEVHCKACNESYELSQPSMDKLNEGSEFECDKCGESVRIEEDEKKTRFYKFVVFYFTIGFFAMFCVSLGNLIGDVGFPTIAVAIPLFIGSMILLAKGKSYTVELIPAINNEDNNSNCSNS